MSCAVLLRVCCAHSRITLECGTTQQCTQKMVLRMGTRKKEDHRSDRDLRSLKYSLYRRMKVCNNLKDERKKITGVIVKEREVSSTPFIEE